jgi:hypothetical protein
MWAPSFWSVLHDLWRFFWRLEPKQNSLQFQAPVVVELPPKSSRQLITLDTQVQTKIRLQVDSLYTDESVETIMIRKKLSDHNELLIQSGNLNLIEWLLYMINIQNSQVVLLALRMSPIGRWNQTLKGVASVKIEVQPSTGALMEWFDEQGEGNAGIVERVSPASAITVRSISQAPSGTHIEHEFTEPAWKGLGPVFTRFRH